MISERRVTKILVLGDIGKSTGIFWQEDDSNHVEIILFCYFCVFQA